MDGNGHVVKHGEAYAECYYLQQTRHRRGKYFYKLLDKKVVFIQTNQVLCPFVNVSEEDLTISDTDYQFINDCIA